MREAHLPRVTKGGEVTRGMLAKSGVIRRVVLDEGMPRATKGGAGRGHATWCQGSR